MLCKYVVALEAGDERRERPEDIPSSYVSEEIEGDLGGGPTGAPQIPPMLLL